MARKKYEMKIDPRKANIIGICFSCNILCLVLGVFTEETFYFMMDILIVFTAIPYLKFEYQRLNKIGPRLVIISLATVYAVFSLMMTFLSLV